MYICTYVHAIQIWNKSYIKDLTVKSGADLGDFWDFQKSLPSQFFKLSIKLYYIRGFNTGGGKDTPPYNF